VVDDVHGLVDLDVLDDVVVPELELRPAPDVRDVLETGSLESPGRAGNRRDVSRGTQRPR